MDRIKRIEDYSQAITKHLRDSHKMCQDLTPTQVERVLKTFLKGLEVLIIEHEIVELNNLRFTPSFYTKKLPPILPQYRHVYPRRFTGDRNAPLKPSRYYALLSTIDKHKQQEQ